MPLDASTFPCAPPARFGARRSRTALAAWLSGVLLGIRTIRDERLLREAEPRLLADVGLTRGDVARGALRRPRRGL